MRRLMRGAAAVHAIVLVMALAACDRGEASAGMSDSTFVATMAELRKIQEDPTLDSAAQAAARTRVLQSRGLTPEELERAARALADDPAHAAEVVQAIDRQARGDTTPDRPRAKPR
jgi:hypothetical protein